MLFLNKISYYTRAYFEMHIAKRTVVSYLPEYIGVEITNVCNFKCSFCPQSDFNHVSFVPRTYLNEEKCGSYLRSLREAGVKTDLIHWTLDGEPFMNKDFHKLCHLGVKYGFTNAFFATNGVLCTVDRLMEFPIDECKFTLSIDYCADEELFEKNRGTKNSWEKIKENIIAIMQDERLSNIFIGLTDISSYVFDDKKELKKRYNDLKELFGCHPKISYWTKTFHNATGFLSKAINRSQKYHLCPYPWTTLRIAANGDIVACCRDLRHETILGDLNASGLKEIWNGKSMQMLRKVLLDKKPERAKACKGCDLPYDDSKFTFGNLVKVAKGRIQLFSK
jgi:radical SAM protein with 4Fe4S-binding SPASM domain